MGNTFTTSSATASTVPASARADYDGPHRIPLVPEPQLRQLHATTPQSGVPRYAALRPKASDGSAKQRWEVLFYPTPDAALTLEYRYSLISEPLSEAKPYPLGGRQYAELLLASCQAVADQRQQTDRGGMARFTEKLAAAVQQDVQVGALTEGEIWPIDLGADGLSVSKGYLKRLAGKQFGYGPHPGAWTHKEAQDVNLAVETGLRKFYNPTVLPGEVRSHEWSFLKPLASLNLTSGAYQYDLPDDFAMLQGPLTYAPGAAVLYPPVQLVGEHQLRQRLQRSEASSRPYLAAVRPKVPGGPGGTRYELLVYPVPEQSYELTFRYAINPSALDDDLALPLGGQAHMQTLIESVLAAVEEQQGALGDHTLLFQQRLEASVRRDRAASAPDTLGLNHDPSDTPMDLYGSWHDLNEGVVRVNGVAY